MKRYIVCLALLAAAPVLFAGCMSDKEMTEKKEPPEKKGFEANIAEIEGIANNVEKGADWTTVYRASVALRNLKDKRTERVFLKILGRKAPIRLRKDSDLPQVMAPLDMLKSVAVESLYDTGGRAHLEIFRRVYKETEEPLLGKIISKHIRALEGEKAQ